MMAGALELWLAIISSSFGKPEAPQRMGEPLAVVEEKVQDIRVRRARTANWIELRLNDKLYLGDRVFVGEESKARIRYMQTGHATVTMPSWSFLQIAKDPLSASQQLRGIQPASGKTVATAQKDESYSGLMLQRKVETLILLQPRREAFIQSDKSNSYFEVRVAPSFEQRDEKLYGELWLITPNRQPIWSGYEGISESCDCYAFNFKLPLAGQYSFVASNANGTKATVAVPLSLEKVSANILPPLLKPRDLVVVP